MSFGRVKRLAKIEPGIAEQIIQTIDENEVENHCGSKYQRGSGENRYQRGGTYDRNPVTAVGKLNTSMECCDYMQLVISC